MTTTIDACFACTELFSSAETKSFIKAVNLPSNITRDAKRFQNKLCIPCLQEYLGDEHNIEFITFYELVVQEKTIIWSEEDEETTNDENSGGLVP